MINDQDYPHKHIKSVFTSWKVVHYPTCDYIFLTNQSMKFYDVVIIRQNELDGAIYQFVSTYSKQFPESKIVFLASHFSVLSSSIAPFFTAMICVPVSLMVLKMIVFSITCLDRSSVQTPLLFNPYGDYAKEMISE